MADIYTTVCEFDFGPCIDVLKIILSYILVNDLRQTACFLHVLWLPPWIELTTVIEINNYWLDTFDCFLYRPMRW
jgi:hypothetical protein